MLGAWPRYRLCIEQLTKEHGADSQCTLQAQNNLAVLLEECQQFQEAEKLHTEVARIYQWQVAAFDLEVLHEVL